ncbi:hypothetical protein Bbelb_295570 [Branchiostoma belcheri]|nr:hypothetical protein Bbelb_295570 [Branchiostoma belcheri]
MSEVRRFLRVMANFRSQRQRGEIAAKDAPGSSLDPARDLTAARPNCKSRSAPYRKPHGSRRGTDRAPDGSLTETGRQGDQNRRTLGVMTPAGVYTEDMPNGRRFKCDLSISRDTARHLRAVSPTGDLSEESDVPTPRGPARLSTRPAQTPIDIPSDSDNDERIDKTVSARPRVGSPDGRRPEGDPTRGRAGTEGDAEYTVLYFIYIIPTQENTPFNAI